jgi:PAS domain S-box-containing protein
MAGNTKSLTSDGLKREALKSNGLAGSSALQAFNSSALSPTGVPEAPAGEGAGWLDGGLAILDANGRITDINETFSHWLEQPVSDVMGQVLWELLEARCPAWRESLGALRSRDGTFAEVKLRLASGDFPAALENGADVTPAPNNAGPRTTSGPAASDTTSLPPPGPSGIQWFSLELARQVTASFVRLHSILPPLADLAEATWDEHLRNESARREMFVRLLRAEAQLKTLSDRWPGVIFSQRADFTFRFVSPKIEELTGVSVAEWQAKPHLFWHVVHESDAEELRQQLKHARQTGQAVTCTYRVRHAQTGRVAYVLEHRQPGVSRGGLLLGYEGVWLDVTRQTIAEKRLSSAAWKETLSVLTMGLAHDFSNVMAGIHALSESFLDQVGAGHEFTEGLTLIKTNTRQASHLVHRIINLHQGKTGDSNYHNLNEVAADLADLIRKIIPRRLQFTTELTAEPLPVYLDVVELRQVVLNLVLNAIDAMPQTGRLVLRTAADHKAPDAKEEASSLAPGTLRLMQGTPPRLPAARLSVQDSGCGIQPRHLASIFDPFFTTKPPNKGSGLGLYNAKLFIEKHRGAITVESKEGAGTAFHLWLPQADFTEAEQEAQSTRAETNPLVPRASEAPGAAFP